MKKVLLLILTIILAFSSIPAGAVTLEIDGTGVDAPMLFEDSTAYVPLTYVAKAINKRIDFDEKSQCVFINGINLFPEKGNSVTVYVNGKKYTPTDSTSAPKVQNGEVYLPAHLAAEAIGMDAVWYNETATLVFTTPQLETPTTIIDQDKTYAIINQNTSEALSAGDNSLSVAPFTRADNQKFKFIKTEFDGYYNIQSILTGKNLDVNSHGTTPGVSIITWDMGTGDNQKFTIEDVPGGTLISARSCHLPIEPNNGGVLQNTRTESLNQKWQIVEFDAYAPNNNSKKAEKLIINYIPTIEEKKPEEAPYKVFTLGDNSLADINGLKMVPSDNSDAQKWKVFEQSKDVFIIENITTAKSLDVNARSFEAGASIITWQTSQDTNQRWIFEKNGDGTVYIKSIHSSLYLTVTDDNMLVQQPKDIALKQRWTVTSTH